MPKRIGRFNLVCLILLLITLLLYLRSIFVHERFIMARQPLSESWIAAAEGFPWIGHTPKVTTNIEYDELALGPGGIYAARARFAQREESPDLDPTNDADAAPIRTPWGAPNAPGVYHLSNNHQWMTEPYLQAQNGFPFFRTSGRDLYTGFPAQTWIEDVAVIRIPLWTIAAALIVASLLRFAVRRLRQRAPGTCAVCGYDLRASAERCPECGSPIVVKEILTTACEAADSRCDRRSRMNSTSR